MLNGTTESPPCEFLIGGGVMGELIRAKDWSATPLGPIEDWPQSLRITVSLCLASSFPINLIWGPQHVQIYNDGYRPLCAGKHPQSLGEDFTKTWASAWPILEQPFRGALAGHTTFLENQRMFLDRDGYLEEAFFTFSMSPIRDESGQVAGLFHPVTEITSHMLSQRRTRALQDLASWSGRSKSVQESCDLSAQSLANYQFDLPFALIYLIDGDGAQARLSGSAHLSPGTCASPATIDLREEADSVWPLPQALATRRSVRVDGLAERFGPLACGPYPESPETALVLPIMMSEGDLPAAFLIAGVSPRLPFTEEYGAFVDLLAATLTAALLNARTYEEERKRAEKLAELDKAKTEFFCNVSHEFRTPVTLLLGPLEEILSQGGKELVAKRDLIEFTHRNSLRLLRLVDRILDFSRVEANRVQAVYQLTDLAAFTRDLCGVFRSVVEKGGLLFNVNCQDLADKIYVDRAMWETIVLNLLSNAFKFTFQGSITVELHDHPQEVELAVSDTGTGIPAQELPNIFKRFHRVRGARGRTSEGFGIGLALVENLVQLHGGTVRVESEVARGTTFYVRVVKGLRHLPAGQVDHASEGASSNAAGPMFVEEALRWLPEDVSQPAVRSNGHAKRVLLAHHNAEMRQYIEQILAPVLMPEFEIEAVSDGVQALRSIRNRPPDLVLADVKMPELDGFELLKELRGDPRTQAIPVIMLSARAGEEAQIEGLPAGADDYLVKPFNARELLARVRVNLELAQLREKLSREEEKRRGADDMERQWRLFDTALSHSAEALLIFDRERRFIYANQVLLQRVRKPLAEVLGKTLLDVGYPPHIDAQQAEEFARVLQECVPLRSKFSMVDAAGKERHYDYFMVPVLSNGAVEAIAVTSWDVTQFIETNRELREANADLEQFAYSASHDLKSPLRVIANASKWLEEDLRPHLTPETREHIDLLRGRVVRMDKLLDDLLAYARIGRTPDKWKLQTIMGDALLNDVLALLPCEGFQVIISPAFAQIRLCRMPLSQVLMNLIDNAIKHHGGKTGRIEITVEDRGARYEFAVKDDGPGIAPEFHERIFKLFQTLKPKDQVEGAGMGLALVRKWVELFGGTIRVDSTDGEGSAFRFTWPKEQSRGLTK